MKRGKKLSFVKRARVKLRPTAKGKERNGKPNRAAKEKDLHSKDKFIKAEETALMIGSGSVCTVEGVKVSAFGFSPDEAVRAVASLPGGGGKETARERRGNNENAVLYI